MYLSNSAAHAAGIKQYGGSQKLDRFMEVGGKIALTACSGTLAKPVGNYLKLGIPGKVILSLPIMALTYSLVSWLDQKIADKEAKKQAEQQASI